MESATDFAKFDSDKTQELLKKARDLANSALQDIRNALSSLRNLDNPKSTGVREISELTKTFANATGVEIKMEYGNMPWTFGSDVDHAIYHCIQEGMVNSFYHGKATKIDIRFWISNAEIHIYIRDNGTGAKDVSEGIGIKGMKERVALLGGRISYYSNDGFEVRLAIPVGER
jgi:signal transduction histidine kinase